MKSVVNIEVLRGIPISTLGVTVNKALDRLVKNEYVITNITYIPFIEDNQRKYDIFIEWLWVDKTYINASKPRT
jgi:hypothetical protein